MEASLGQPVGAVELWLHGKSPHTQRAYRTEANRFLSVVARPLRAITLMDLQLPVTSGPEAIRRIRQIDHSARIIALSPAFDAP